ncbi:MAG TPA: hypothetical protein VNE61_12245, partial [Ktedonobacteraceae bacterium]|nr:hypothetical protein [Ktedonobacteraceae bacterium]
NNSRVIRIEPPVVITYEEIDAILNRLEDTLQELRGSISTPGIVAVAETPVGADSLSGGEVISRPSAPIAAPSTIAAA